MKFPADVCVWKNPDETAFPRGNSLPQKPASGRMARADGSHSDAQFAAAALHSAGMCGFVCSLDTDELIWGAPDEAASFFPPGPAPSTLPQFLRRIDDRDRPAFEHNVQRAWRERGQFSARIRVEGTEAGREAWIALSGRAILQDGELALAGVLYRLSEGESHEEDLRALIKELNHRVKNILISIGAIAAQSIKPGESLESYVDHLRGRIRALSSVHDILTRSNWRGVPLSAVVKGEIAVAAEAQPSNVTIRGEELLLKPRAGQSLALAIHELTANSVRFGALSWRGGNITIGWEGPNEIRPALVVTWEETGFGPLPKAREPGFGSVVLKELLPQEIDAAVSYEMSHNLVRCIIVAPAEWLCKA
jgi:two-component sensor histidine kinase